MTNLEQHWMAVIYFAYRPETHVVGGANGNMNSAWKIFGVAPRSWSNNAVASNSAAPPAACRKYQRTSLWWLYASILSGRPELPCVNLTDASAVQCRSPGVPLFFVYLCQEIPVKLSLMISFWLLSCIFVLCEKFHVCMQCTNVQWQTAVEQSHCHSL